MSQWSLRERLQPSLLDRLTDDRPDQSKESTSQQFLDVADLKRAVTRDLSALLNCVALDVVYNMDAFPLVKDSVLNYGVPDLSGQTASTLNAQEIEAGIRRAILLYEPRILRHGLRIKIHSEQNDISANNLIFEIEGTVFGQPAPFQIILQSEMDLENGSINLKDQ